MNTYNKEHIKELIGYFWQGELEHFEEVYDTNLINQDWDNKEEVGAFLNLCVKEERTAHIFYTIVQLHYETL